MAWFHTQSDIVTDGLQVENINLEHPPQYQAAPLSSGRDSNKNCLLCERIDLTTEYTWGAPSPLQAAACLDVYRCLPWVTAHVKESCKLLIKVERHSNGINQTSYCTSSCYYYPSFNQRSPSLLRPFHVHRACALTCSISAAFP